VIAPGTPPPPGPTPSPTVRRIGLATGLHYNVLEWGAEAAHQHTVLLVHGFLDNAWAWEDIGARLADRFHVIAPDMRGHGDSDRVGKGGYYHFMDYIADLASLVEQVARRALSLVGHSMGGGIVGYYAGTFPERVATAAFLEGLGPPEEVMGPQRVAAWIKGWNKVAGAPHHRKYPSLEAAAERLIHNDPLLPPGLALRQALHGTAPNPDGTFSFKHDPLHLTSGPYGFTFAVCERFWRRITCPVLSVEGAVSTFRLAADDAARRHGCFGDLHHEVLPQAAHMMHRHQPVLLAEALARHAERARLPGATNGPPGEAGTRPGS
jgi:pimeloyl-ACP methyl ester carboxylesterase